MKSHHWTRGFVGNVGLRVPGPLVVFALAFLGASRPEVQAKPPPNALHFNGTSQFVQVPLGEEIILDRALTLEAWVKVAVFDQKWQPILTQGDAWGLMRYNDTDKIAFRTSDGADGHDLVSDRPLPLGEWHHVAAVYDGSQKRLYLDGVLSASATYAVTRLAQTPYPVLLGGYAVETTRYFNGDLDNVRLWSLARSPGDIQTGTNHYLRGSETGLLGEWRFNETDGLTAFDSSAHALHGSLKKANAPPTRISTGVPHEPPLPGALALQFSGDGQCVAVPPSATFNFRTHCTLETWVFLDFTPRETNVLISKGAGAWELAVAPNGKIVFHTPGVTGEDPEDSAKQAPAPDLLSKSQMDAGAWYHLAAVWNGPAGRKEIYLNGQLDETATSLQGSVSVNSRPVLLGARPSDSGTNGFLAGILDEVRLWSLARSGPQIAANFARDLNRTEPGLVGFWDFNEGNGLVATDGAPGAGSPGDLCGGMSNLNRVSGITVGAPLPLQYALTFDGVNEYLLGGTQALGPLDLTNLTIEAWVKPTGAGFRNILMKGDHGYGLALDANNYLRYFIDSTTQNSLRSSRPLEREQDADGNPLSTVAWNHVGVVVDRAANTTTFYINGKPAGTHASSVILNNSGPIVLGKQGTVATANYFQGQMDEVRVWNLPRTSLEIDLFAFTPLLTPNLPGLVGYWNFNEGSGTVALDHSSTGNLATLQNMDSMNWTDGTDWGVPLVPGGIEGLMPNPGAAGLWIGQVTLHKVNEVQQAVQGAAETLTDTSDTATIRLLLHVAANGQVRMLKDVILMKKIADTNAPATVSTNPLPAVEVGSPTNSSLVLVTRPELISNFDGVAKRGGKRVGLRYGTVAYDFDGTELGLLGGVGPGAACLGRINLSKNHPTNPYRHKYHPDHRVGFEILRQFTLQFDGAPGDPLLEAPGYGVDRLTGVYRETVMGLHKVPLKMEGTVQLDRISTVAALNE